MEFVQVHHIFDGGLFTFKAEPRCMTGMEIFEGKPDLFFAG